MKKLLAMMLTAMLAFTACGGDEPDVLKVSFKEKEITLQFEDSYKLEPIVESGNFDPSKAVWTSSDEHVATVDNGYINARFVFREGEATISLLYNGAVLATCKVIVVPVKATSIKLDNDRLDMVVGESVLLRAAVTSENHSIGVVYNLTWESSDKNVVTVSGDGEVVAMYAGNAIITVTDTKSGLSDKCEVSVKSRAVTGITCPENVKMIVGDCVQVKATIVPEDATNTGIIWTTSNPSIATVDNNGNMCGIALGETIVMAKTVDGGFEAKCNVSVVELPDMITAKAIEGFTTSGAKSNCHLTLLFETNTNNPVFINSVIMTMQDGTIVSIDYPNEFYTFFQKTYITHYFDASSGISIDAINAEKAKIKGWKFYVQYTWNNNEYTIECINR